VNARNQMLNFLRLEEIDSKRMFETYEKWPEIAKKQFDTSFEEINYYKENV